LLTFSSTCEVTAVIIGCFNRFCDLLTYLYDLLKSWRWLIFGGHRVHWSAWPLVTVCPFAVEYRQTKGDHSDEMKVARQCRCIIVQSKLSCIVHVINPCAICQCRRFRLAASAIGQL